MVLFLKILLLFRFEDSVCARNILILPAAPHCDGSKYGEKSQLSVLEQVQQLYFDIRREQLEQDHCRAEGENKSMSDLIIPGLKATLRSYQEDAVIWMLRHEGVNEEEQTRIDERKDELHVLWRKLPVRHCETDSQSVYFNPYTSR